MDDATCSVAGCERPRQARGWCGTHYARWLRCGDVRIVRPSTGGISGLSVQETFWTHVDKCGPVPDYRPDLGPCWLWLRPPTVGGYGQLRADGRSVFSHRYAYELLVGAVAPGLQLDHLCRVPACLNPSHLEPVTPRENTLRGIAARREAATHGP